MHGPGQWRARYDTDVYSQITKSAYQKSVRLPRKQVLDEMADKEKAVPEEADIASFGTAFYVVKIISEL